jgi:hypothetical protein
MGTPISGNGGKVTVGNTDIGDVLQWNLNITKPGTAYTSNSTAQGRKRVAGNQDCTGTIRYMLDSAAALPLAAGDTPILTLVVASGKSYSVNTAYIESVDVTVPIDSGAPVEHSASFSRNGTITAPTFP